jgi:hypothetical protein
VSLSPSPSLPLPLSLSLSLFPLRADLMDADGSPRVDGSRGVYRRTAVGTQHLCPASPSRGEADCCGRDHTPSRVPHGGVPGSSACLPALTHRRLAVVAGSGRSQPSTSSPSARSTSTTATPPHQLHRSAFTTPSQPPADARVPRGPSMPNGCDASPSRHYIGPV